MSASRFFAVVLIFLAAGSAWMILGATMEYRTAKLESSLSKEVNSLWGPAGLTQASPFVAPAQKSDEAPREAPARTAPLGSDVRADFVHHNRYKGLLWFSTYTVTFSGTYEVQWPGDPEAPAEPTAGLFVFELPQDTNVFEDLKIELDGAAEQARSTPYGSNTIGVPLPPDGKKHTVLVTYKTRGRDRWLYEPRPANGDHGRLSNFTLTATMNFTRIDYPKGSASPVSPAKAIAGGTRAVWKYNNVLTSQPMGVEMPSRLNAGPIAARMSFFAPVSLFFFFTVLFTVVVLKKIPLHPMHYLFISAGFFAFHILLAYLVDIINVHGAFWICAAVSVFLVVSYMRLVGGVKFALTYVGLCQLVYLVGFSYAFFWEGRTGLTVTIGAIVTLFVLMQATGRVKWHEVFRRPAPPMPPLPVRPAPAPAPQQPGQLPAGPFGQPQTPAPPEEA